MKDVPKTITVPDNWENVFRAKALGHLQDHLLAGYLVHTRWFKSKARIIQGVKIIEDIRMSRGSSVFHLLYLEVRYTEGMPETFQLPLGFATGAQAQSMVSGYPVAFVCTLFIKATKKAVNSIPGTVIPGEPSQGSEPELAQGILYDAIYGWDFPELLLSLLRGSHFEGHHGIYRGQPGRKLKSLLRTPDTLKPQVLKAEQSNTSIVFGNRLIFKLYRSIGQGVNPEEEITRYLSEEQGFPYCSPFAGSLQYVRQKEEPFVSGIFFEYIHANMDGWHYTLDEVERFFARALAGRIDLKETLHCPASLVQAMARETPKAISQTIGNVFVDMISLLAHRIAEMHLCLAGNISNDSFKPELFSSWYQHSLYQSIATLVKKTMHQIRRTLHRLPDTVQGAATTALDLEGEIYPRLHHFLQTTITSDKIRIHGDLHLGQVLFTGNDFIIIDFEGEPNSSLSQRRIKRSPLSDIAGMIRSLHYAVSTVYMQQAALHPENAPILRLWADIWHCHTAASFLRSYVNTVKGTNLIPSDLAGMEILLNVLLLEKALYEIGYEVNNRPQWLNIPVMGLMHLLKA